jgi:hypothetical protein
MVDLGNGEKIFKQETRNLEKTSGVVMWMLFWA